MCEACPAKLQELIDNDPRAQIKQDIAKYPQIQPYLQQLHTQFGATIKRGLEADEHNPVFINMLHEEFDNLQRTYAQTIDNHLNGNEAGPQMKKPAWSIPTLKIDTNACGDCGHHIEYHDDQVGIACEMCPCAGFIYQGDEGVTDTPDDVEQHDEPAVSPEGY